MKKIIIYTQVQEAKTQEQPPSWPLLHRNLTVIEVAEAELLDMLQADRRIAPFIVAKLSDCVALIAANKAQLAIKQLLKLGHTPRIISEINAR